MVKTQCRCWTLRILKDMEVVLSMEYIGRYLGRPVIATSRIDSYDGEFVTFHYNRHEDEKLVTETLPVLDFMARLTQHIPEKHFKMIMVDGSF